jgi:gluconate 2-dehydrogenase gamma chain
MVRDGFSATPLKKEGHVLNRREVLLAGAAASAALVSGCHTRGSRWLVFTDAEARTLGTLCDQIVPADEWPSASEAGVVTFIDRQLTGPYRRYRKTYSHGLEDTGKLAASRFGIELARVSVAQQLQVAQEIERQNSEFFELVRRHTLQGYYGSPRHGGNKDAVSWRMLGLAEPPLRGRAQYDFSAGPKA